MTVNVNTMSDTNANMNELIAHVQGFIMNEKQRLHIKEQFDSAMKQNNTRPNIKNHKKIIQGFFQSEVKANQSMMAIQVALDDGPQTETNTVWVIPTIKKKKLKLNLEDRLAVAVAQMLVEPNAVNSDLGARAVFLATRFLAPLLLSAMQSQGVSEMAIPEQAIAIAKAVTKPVKVSLVEEAIHSDMIQQASQSNVNGVKMVSKLPDENNIIIYLNPNP
jgi:hypothetical protein